MGRNRQPKYWFWCRRCGWKGKRTSRIGYYPCPRCKSARGMGQLLKKEAGHDR